ncbi:hypothetical protein MRX96_029732 [Rhipicephalus microplus]
MNSSGAFDDQPGGCSSASEPQTATDSLLCVEDGESSTLDMKILCAQSTEELQAAKESLRGLGHAQCSQRVEAFLQCEQQWVLLHRVGLITRAHNTNSYSEASIQILKDIVLSRNKAYNAVALVEYIMTKWEEYCKLRLLHHAHHRDPSHQIRFQNLLEKMPDMPLECIVLLGDAMYSVPSLYRFGSY